ncbi:MAG: flagellar motor protein MotB [Pseudomonadota bacterium]
MSVGPQTIIIKRPKVVKGDGHHGGAWKVAYADFVTAMMAFFLLMWLLNATTEEQRQGLADYFNPSIPIAAVSGGGSDGLNGEEVVEAPALATLKRHRSDGDDMEVGRAVAATGTEDPAVSEAVESALRAALSGEAGELSEHISIRVTPEGLVVELTDRDTRPLFASGSADPSPVLVKLTKAVAMALDAVENDVKIAGHTDSRRYPTPLGYSNWELSSDRANAARRLIKKGGLPEARIQEVSGKAATMPLVAEDPLDARNRRISITLLRRPA